MLSSLCTSSSPSCTVVSSASLVLSMVRCRFASLSRLAALSSSPSAAVSFRRLFLSLLCCSFLSCFCLANTSARFTLFLIDDGSTRRKAAEADEDDDEDEGAEEEEEVDLADCSAEAAFRFLLPLSDIVQCVRCLASTSERVEE